MGLLDQFLNIPLHFAGPNGALIHTALCLTFSLLADEVSLTLGSFLDLLSSLLGNDDCVVQSFFYLGVMLQFILQVLNLLFHIHIFLDELLIILDYAI